MTSLLPASLCSTILALPTSAPAMPDAQTAGKWLDRGIEWFKQIPQGWLIYAVLIGVALLVLRRLLGGLGRAWRRNKPVNINPKLAKYNVDKAEVARQQRELSHQIEATSTGRHLAGYRIIRQVEAVFVEGYATPEDALIALKATAAERRGQRRAQPADESDDGGAVYGQRRCRRGRAHARHPSAKRPGEPASPASAPTGAPDIAAPSQAGGCPLSLDAPASAG